MGNKAECKCIRNLKGEVKTVDKSCKHGKCAAQRIVEEVMDEVQKAQLSGVQDIVKLGTRIWNSTGNS